MLGQVAERLFIGGDKTPELEMAIRGRLRDLLKGGSADAISVARSLGLSERSLHRRLADSGRTYQAVLDDFRAGEAGATLARQPCAARSAALALGFADQTAFSRAFRRWKGGNAERLAHPTSCRARSLSNLADWVKHLARPVRIRKPKRRNLGP